MNWPDRLYAHEPLHEGDQFDVYKDLDGVEEDDTIGIYRLEKVVRVKIKRTLELRSENDLNLILETYPMQEEK